MRLLAAVPDALTNVPGAHVPQRLQASAFFSLLNEPGAQLMQVRSATGVAGVPTYCPAPHSVAAVQTLAGFPSWSQVPAPQACGAMSSPAQYWPGAHGMQVAAIPAVPGAICRVPGAHVPSGTQRPELGASENVPASHGAQRWSALIEPAIAT
jgi:hypothetical protein